MALKVPEPTENEAKQRRSGVLAFGLGVAMGCIFVLWDQSGTTVWALLETLALLGLGCLLLGKFITWLWTRTRP